jgi:hypothetical protein
MLVKSENIQDLISGKHDREEVHVDELSIPIRTLKKVLGDGYAHLKVYKEKRTVSLWGKPCCACFSEQQLRERD